MVYSPILCPRWGWIFGLYNIQHTHTQVVVWLLAHLKSKGWDELPRHVSNQSYGPMSGSELPRTRTYSKLPYSSGKPTKVEVRPILSAQMRASTWGLHMYVKIVRSTRWTHMTHCMSRLVFPEWINKREPHSMFHSRVVNSFGPCHGLMETLLSSLNGG